MTWAPLHVHSQYSILDATAPVAALAAKAKQCGMPALALTDDGNLFGAVDFFKACKKEEIKPLLGCALSFTPSSRFEKKRIPGVPSGYPLVLLAKDQKGYHNLCKLSSLGYLEGFYYTPRIDKELLIRHHEGLICLSGPLSGFIPQLVLQGNETALLEEVLWFHSLFKEDYYFEIQRHRMSEEHIREVRLQEEPWAYQYYLDQVERQEKVVSALSQLSEKLSIGLVATNGSRYLERADWRAHEILMNIQSGEPCEIWERDSAGNPKNRVLNPKRQILFSQEFYFKSAAEMELLFAQMPQALSTSLEIVSKCHFEMDFKTKHYPVFVPPHLEGVVFSKEEREKQAASFLRTLCHQGLSKRYTPERLAKIQEKYPERDPDALVKERLDYELELIISKGMCDYLLIVYDFIAWAKRQNIPMGPGRGSGAGSIVLYLIEITDIEPLRFHLFFERFINPERISYPDIDVDICMDRRSEVIDYTVRKYGKEKVAQIITFGTMKAKMAIKDVGRVLSVPLAKVNEISKLVPEDPTMTIEKALEIDPDLRNLYDTDSEVHNLIDIAKKLEGSVRSSGIHAAGLIIGAEPIIDHIPVCVAKDSDMVVTQFSMKPVEAVGMLKIDFLGLKTLTSIQKAVKAIEANHQCIIDWVNLPLEDAATFNLLNQGKTLGVFQLESPGMQELARQLHIDKFEEIIAVESLYRPGPMEMIPSFVQRKHGREQIEIDHPLMHDVLAETYGIMVYQEQVMQIASLLANYSLGEGDVLRRAMGKKDKEEMARQREKFRAGALSNGIDEQTSTHIFNKIEKFASYGFNKSHAAAYGYLSYVTAYLKANYPKEWMAALMTSDIEDITKIAKLIRECQSMDIFILPPDINESGKEFAATPRGIRFAMMGIKGIGEGVVDAIIEERNSRGPFVSLYDFFERTDTKKVGKKTVETLIEAGCFDFTQWQRQALVVSVDPMYEAVARQQKEAAKGIMNFLGLIEDEKNSRFLKPPKVEEPVSRQQILKRENELLGFYLTGHPLDDFRPHLPRLSCIPLAQLVEMQANGVGRVACTIEMLQVKISAKSQRKFALLMISDGLERFELPIWPELYEAKHSLLKEHQLLYAVIQVEREEGAVKLQCRWLGDLTSLNEAVIKECDIAYDKAKMHVRQIPFKERKMKQKEEIPRAQTTLSLAIDIDRMRLSHILELKSFFRASPGSTASHLEFFRGAHKAGTIFIDSNWGVQFNKSLEEKIKRINAIKVVSFG